MTWASVPAAAGDSSITMTATTATDASGVEYQFTRYAADGTTLLFTSPWQDSPSFTDTGLSANTTYSYTVIARDKSPNQNATALSTPAASATTDPADEVAPAPDPMTFAVAPAADGSYSISMTATTATDNSGVEYYFDETSGNSGGTDSGWQDSPSYTDNGLSSNTQYTYTVTARDKSTAQNTTDPSTSASATTEDIDNIAPAPNPMTFAVAPGAVSSSAITMTATTANDPSGVEYFFDETSGKAGGTDSGWQDSPVYTDTGLNADTAYSYTVTARDKGPLQNPTAASTAALASTYPTAIISWTAHNITNSVSNVSQNGTLHEARNGGNSSQFVNGTVFESVQNSGNLFDSLFSSDTLQNSGYGSVVTALSYQAFLKQGQRSGRPTFNDPPRIASTQDWATVNFTGLTVGNIYEVQIWASYVGFAEDGVAQSLALVLGDGSTGAPVYGTDTQLFYEVTDYGAGQYGTGTFVAVATTQSFNVQAYDTGNTPATARTQDHTSNGWQIRDLGPSVSDFDSWAGNYPGLGAADDDDDGDGLTNEQERIFGLDPQDGASANAYVVPFNPATGAFSYTRRTRSLTGLAHKVWYSTNLNQWFEDTGAVQTPGSPANDVETVGVQLSPALLTQPKLFIRLSAGETILPPPAPRLNSTWGSGTTITLNFSEAMNETSATNPANYAVTGGTVTGASLSPDGKTVTLALASPLGIGSAYDVTLSNLTGSEGAPLTGSATAQFYNWDNDPTGIKVFILAGQSNMVGYGHSETGGNPAWTSTNGEPKSLTGGPGSLRYLAKNNGLYSEYDYTSLLSNTADTDSAWKTRPDVKVWWEQGVSGNLGGTEGFGDLGPPFRGGNTDWFGPEYGFGQVIGDFYASNDVLIIKTAWGGHSLGGNFRPPTAVADRGGVVGLSYDEMLTNVRFILENLGAKFPDWNDGRGYQIVGFAFHQGYSDRVVPNLSPEYKENLPDFIHDVRAAFGKPDLPFVIASTGMDTTFVESSPYPNYTEVEQAQLWVAGDAAPANVRSSDTRSFMEAAVDSPRNQGFHWHGNARSYFRIGKALGDDMVNLLTP
jgi:alpha-galactosidase